MHQSRFYLITVCIVCSFCSFSCSERPPSRPNIILIMADDLGYQGIGCFGNDTLQTPHLDALAKAGLLFTDYHSNGSVCTPTRAAMLTGNYQQRSGLEGVIYVKGETRQVGLDTTTWTMAQALRAGGYQTGIMGKWHLGYLPEYNPIHHGFDEFYGYVSGNIDFHSHYDNAGIYDWYHNLDSIQEEGYVTDLITDHAVDFIEKHQEEPFFLYVPHEAPHVPFQGRNDPPYRFADNEFTYYGPVKDRSRAYREMVEVLDEGVGRLIASVRRLGLEDNTLIVFVSDNGAERFGHNGELNGDKGSLLEGGQRVPAIAYWKNKIKPGRTDEIVMSFDWMATFLSLGDLSTAQPTLDGLDLSDLLLKGQALPERDLFWRYRQERAVRSGPWKLWLHQQDTMLFNLQEDLGEVQNQALGQPKVLEELLGKYQAWETEMDRYSQKTK